MPYKISMPHRHTVIYEEDGVSKVVFEVELLSNGIVLYAHSPRYEVGNDKNIQVVVGRVRDWLAGKFSEVILDSSPPPTFNL